MTPQELKLSILLHAFKGKLVEHNSAEGTGKELFSKISKTNPLKKKVIPFTNEPFDIPDNWIWCPLNELAKIVVGATPSTSRDDYWNGGDIPWIPSGCCKDSPIDNTFSQIKYITKMGYESCSTVLMDESTVVIALTGATAGKVGILRFVACGNQSVVGIKPFDGLLPEFVFYCLMARRSEILSDCVGSAQPHISKEYITKMLFPLPPFEEQKRIVTKIEELLPLIDRYEEAWNKLEAFNKRFPTDLEISIIKCAITGKLVEQNNQEGTAEELFQTIQNIKKELSKNGVIKGSLKIKEFTTDEIPFEIPSNWKWVRISDVIDVRDGTHDTPKYVPNGYPLITGKDFYYGYFNLSKTQFVSKEDYLIISERSKVDIGDILFSMIGGNIGSMIKITEDNYFEMSIKNVALFKQYSTEYSMTDYLFYYLRSAVTEFKKIAKGGAQSFVPLNLLRDYPMPLPPLEEQKRIVAKLDELLTLCRKLVK